MKSLKKLLSIFAAFMMVVGLTAANVKAADGDTPSTNGTITLKDGRDGVTYTPYQIFGLSVGANNGSYAYTIAKDSNFYTWMIDNKYLVSEKPTTGGTQVDVVETGKTNTPMWFTVNEQNAIKFSNDIYKAVNDKSLTLPEAAGTAFTANKDNTTTSWKLPLGYYIIIPTMLDGNLAANVSEGAICNITTNAPSVTVAPKSSKPTVDKVAYEGNTLTDGSVSVGDTLKFVLTGTMPDTTGYATYNYVLTDTMNNLSFDETKEVVVKFGDQEVTLPFGMLKFEGKKMILSFDAVDYKEFVGETITVEYYATVDATAVNTDEDGKPVVIDNKVELSYGPSSDQNGNGTTVTFTTAKLPILKTDDTSGNAKPLAGAEFVLKQDGKDGKYYVRNEDGTNGWGTEAEATKLKSDKEGNLSFEGIAAGSYVLKEVKAPDGYSILTKDIKIEITKTETDNNVTYTVKVTNESELTNIVSATNNTVTVVNTTGNPLPSTGGMGTTMLYVAGAILMVGAAVIFVTNKRMKHE